MAADPRCPTPADVNAEIRRALLKAARAEADRAPFSLSGRGHEPRITLDPRMAAVVRSLDLPHVKISGYGANKHYPLRVFKRAAAHVKKRLGWSALKVSDGAAWRQDPPEPPTVSSQTTTKQDQ
jgi:hypothetical protein